LKARPIVVSLKPCLLWMGLLHPWVFSTASAA
jgi:hypothetical protein